MDEHVFPDDSFEHEASDTCPCNPEPRCGYWAHRVLIPVEVIEGAVVEDDE